MVASDGLLRISGNIANVGDGPAGGAVVELSRTDTLRPTNPQRNYFVGAVPKSDFVGFELGATVLDSGTTEQVPVTIRSLDDGVGRTTTTEIDYEPRSTDGGAGTSFVPVLHLTSALAVIGGCALIWRRRSEWA
jgi:hypothetical protein